MTRKEAFEKIKKLFFAGEPMNVKCTDGTILQWTGELTEGTAVMVVDTDGNQTPAPDKTWEVEDGSMITTVGGLVTKIEKTTPESDEAMLDQVMSAISNMMDKFTAITEKFTAMETKLAGYDEKFTAIENKVKDSGTSAEEKFNAIKEIVEAIGNEPAANPIESPYKFAKKKAEKSPAERIASALHKK